MCLRTLSNKQTFLVTCTFLKIQGSVFAEIYLHYLPLFSYLSSERIRIHYYLFLITISKLLSNIHFLLKQENVFHI